MKYRKKPLIIEADQWFPGCEFEGVIDKEENGMPLMFADENNIFHQCAKIKTLEGDMIVRPGDYVITGIKGEKYPCKPHIFEATYEKIEE